MTQPTFQALLTDLFRTIGTAGGRTVPGVGLCRFNGFDVAIYHDEGTDPNNIHAYIDFGTVPLARQREVFRTLLLPHVIFAPPHRTVVGLDSASGSIVLVAHIPFDVGLSGGRLADIFQQLIREVFIWRPPTSTTRMPATRRGALRRPS